MKRRLQVPRSTQVPNEIFDEHMADLEHSALLCLLYIVRRTLGLQQRQTAIPMSQFKSGLWRGGKQVDKGTGLSESSIRRAIEGLETEGLIRKVERSNSDGACMSNLYELVTDEDEPPPSHARQDPPPPVTPPPSTGDTTPLHGRGGIKETKTKETKEEGKEVTSEADRDEAWVEELLYMDGSSWALLAVQRADKKAKTQGIRDLLDDELGGSHPDKFERRMYVMQRLRAFERTWAQNMLRGICQDFQRDKSRPTSPRQDWSGGGGSNNQSSRPKTSHEKAWEALKNL